MINPRFWNLRLGAYRHRRLRTHVDPRTSSGSRARRITHVDSESETDDVLSDYDGTVIEPLNKLDIMANPFPRMNEREREEQYQEWRSNAPWTRPFPDVEGWRMRDRIDRGLYPVIITKISTLTRRNLTCRMRVPRDIPRSRGAVGTCISPEVATSARPLSPWRDRRIL